MALTTAACGDQSSPIELAYVVRDSAGIGIVENARPPDGSRLGWQVDPEPSVRIGALRGKEPYLLHRVGGATKLSDGRIVVANRGSQELRVFGASGVHLATWGGQGEGPGEFNSLLRVSGWQGDSLIAWYSQDDRLSIFDLNGNVGRTMIPGDLRNRVERASPSGALLVSRSDAGGYGVTEGLVRQERQYEALEADGHQLGSLGQQPEPDLYSLRAGGFHTWWTIPFTRRTLTGAWAGGFVVASTASYEIRVHDRFGNLTLIVRRDHARIKPTSAHLDAYIDRQVAGRPSTERRRVRAQLEELPVVESFPAFDQVVADALGHFWIREYDLPDEERENPLWTVFDPEGRVLGFVETPRGLRVDEIGEDYILGRTTGAFGVEYVEVRSLDRTKG